MNLDTRLGLSLKKRPGNVVLRHELKQLASPSHLSEAIDKLIAQKMLVRLSSGVYAKSHVDERGAVRFSASNQQILEEALLKLGISTPDITVDHEKGRAVFCVNTHGRRISRKFEWDDCSVRFRGNVDRQDVSIPDNIASFPVTSVGDYVERLARKFHIYFKRSNLDDLAEAITRAAGDEVKLDAVGKLLVALRKNNHLNAQQSAQLMLNYTREQRDERSIRPVRGLQDSGLFAK